MGWISRSAAAVCSAAVLATPLSPTFADTPDNQGATSEQTSDTINRVGRLSYEQAASLLEMSRELALPMPNGAGVLPLRMIAVAHWNGGNKELARAVFEEAATAAMEVEDSYARDYALSTVAISQASVGAFELAMKAAMGITDPARLPRVAEALQGAGDFDGARTVLQRIPSSDALYSYRLAGLAIAQAEAGDTKGAERAARQIDKDYDRNRALRAICKTIAASGNVGDAMRLANSIEHSNAQKSAMRDIAVVLAEAGKADQALELARSMKESYVLREISKAHSRAGHTADGRRVAKEALAFAQANNESELGTLLPLIGGFVLAEDLEGARSLLDEVESEPARAEAEKRLIRPEAIELAKEGDMAAALDRLEALEDRSSREAAMDDIVEYLIGIDDLAGAKELIGLFDSSGSGIIRDSALRKLATAYADAGDPISAHSTIEKVKSPRSRRIVLRHLLKLQLRDDDLSAALETARRVPTYQEIRDEPGWRPSVVREFTVDTALYDVSRVQLARGELSQARRTAEEITETDRRTLILREITAKEIANAKDSETESPETHDDALDPTARNRALQSTALQKASDGDLDGALEAIQQIQDAESVRINAFDSSMTQSGALSRVARILILHGQTDDGVRFLGMALESVETISDVGQRQKALLEAIEVL